MFDVMKFLREYRIDYATSGNKHCRPGWVNVHCPFCTGGDGYHLGISIHYGYGNCWRCKGKSMLSVIQSLLNCSWGQAKAIFSKYNGRKGSLQHDRTESRVRANTPDSVAMPPGTTSMTERHKSYLAHRGYDPDLLERVYGLMGTGPVGEYKHRIAIPVELDEELVSYQCRDHTGKSDLPYMACKLDLEVVHHKHMLYGVDLVEDNKAIVVEGCPDTWRLGPGAVGTFGTSFKPAQVLMLNERFDTLFLLYDSETQAQKNATDLSYKLAATGKKVELLCLDKGDPGEMQQNDADALMRDLGLKGWN